MQSKKNNLQLFNIYNLMASQVFKTREGYIASKNDMYANPYILTRFDLKKPKLKYRLKYLD